MATVIRVGSAANRRGWYTQSGPRSWKCDWPNGYAIIIDIYPRNVINPPPSFGHGCQKIQN